jgi:hypothetical protein
MDIVPSLVPQQQLSPPSYPHESIRDQPVDDGRPCNTTSPSQQNMLERYFDFDLASQESDPTISNLEQGFYQACAQHFSVSRYPLEAIDCNDADMAIGPFYVKYSKRSRQRDGSLLFHGNHSPTISESELPW